jgi:FtsP/CotA-like multicopper oxidase with cupredoxin domain
MLTRRTLLAASAVAAAGLWTRMSNGQGTPASLPIPQQIDARRNQQNISLTIAAGGHTYIREKPVRSFGYSAPILGPAIRVRRGETISVSIDNKMDEPTTVHWHGVLIPGSVDGGPHNVIRPGQTWTAKLGIDQPETTAWFHPHPHGATARQVYSGLAGLFLIEDGSGDRLGLPSAYGVDDLPLVLQDHVFGEDGAPIYDPGPMGVMAGYRGGTFIVNGVVDPVAKVPAGIVRLRLVNGANARFFDLQFSDARTFHVVASDGGYLPAPVPLQRLLIAPGERYEILVDFSDGQRAALSTGPDRNLPMMGMMMGGAIPAGGGTLMSFEVDPSLPAESKPLPKTLVPLPAIDRTKVARTRQFLLNDMMMGGGMMMGGSGAGPVMAINGRPFDMSRVDVAVKKGSVELWQIGSQMMGHPFHVHGTQFQILSMNGQMPPAHMRGWKDIVIVAREAEILVPFSQAAPTAAPFMFHCHILEHEDAGMMGQYTCV